MRLNIILASGWGFDYRFWKPLASELSEFKLYYDSRNYFDDHAANIAISQPTIGVGHSMGLSRLVNKYSHNPHMVGFVSICGFLKFSRASSELFAQNTAMQANFARAPVRVLRAFYRQCNLGCWPYIPVKYKELSHDLNLLNSLDIQPPTQPLLALNATKDRILKMEFQKKLLFAPNNCIRTIDAGHALGYQYPQECANYIRKFIYEFGLAQDTTFLRAS